jgi:hypothetical protein
MNYLVEIRLFYDRIEIAPLSSGAMILWHTLMYLMYKAGWPQELAVSIGTLMARSQLERRGVYRARIILRDNGYIEFREQGGNRSALYKIISQAGLQYKNVPQIATQGEDCGANMYHNLSHTEGEQYKNVPQTATQGEGCGANMYHKLSHTEAEQYKNVPQIATQGDGCGANMYHKLSHTEAVQYKNVPQMDDCGTNMYYKLRHEEGERYKNVPQIATQTEPPNAENQANTVPDSDLANEGAEEDDLVKNENDPYISIYINKDRDKGGYRGKKRKVNANENEISQPPKKKLADFDLSFIGEEVWESLVESWLDYKRSRSENYKSELSVKKFYTMLRGYSRGDPRLARQIIDKSIANNWAGIFEPAPEESKPRGQSTVGVARPATGQHIGQIKQPEDEERRRKLLEKFGRPSDKDKNKT